VAGGRARANDAGTARRGALVSLGVAGWLERLRERLAGGPADVEARRVLRVIDARAEYKSAAAWLDAVLAALDVPLLDPHVLTHVAFALRGAGGYGDVPEEEHAAHRRFWATLARRFPREPAVLAHHADTELLFGDDRLALERFLDAFELEAGLWFEFGDDIAGLAEEVGGDALFRWQVAELRAVLDQVPEDEEWVRERYSELLDAYREQPDRLVRLYSVGEEIRRLEAEGALPRAIVLRAPRPPGRPPRKPRSP